MKKSNFQFLDPYIKELHFIENENFNRERNEIPLENSFAVHVQKSQDENMAVVELSLKISSANNQAPFEMRIDLASTFLWENLEDEKVDLLLNVNAPALLLAYIRPIVANITNSSRFPVYNLPFINFSEKD